MDLFKKFNELKKKIIENDFANMNPKQKEAIFCIKGPILILAGAGSGKTTVLVNRIANIIKYGQSFEKDFLPNNLEISDIEEMQKYLDNNGNSNLNKNLLKYDSARAFEILAITFTNKAANELKERLSKMLGEQGQGIWASTFHATCAKILRRYSQNIGYTNNFTVYDMDDSRKLIKTCQNELNIDDKLLSFKSILSEISRSKDSMLTPAKYEQECGTNFRKKQISKAYSLYQRKLKAADAMDFDDILLNTVILFKKYPEILEKYQNQFKYIMVDEYQDTNKVQYEFIRLLAEKHKNLCVVGDDDQSIYKFRGATIENIMNFEKTYKNAKIIRLEQNYRSTQNILNAANGLIKNNSERKGKTLWTQNDNGDKIFLHTAFNEFEESRYIVEKTNELIDEGYSFNDCAVLYRMNAQSNTIEKTLVQHGIPYRIIGGFRFYERREIKDILAYLSVINNPNDTIRLKRIINQPKRAIGEKTVEIIEELASQTNQSMLDVMKNAAVFPELSRSHSKLKDFSALIQNFINYNKEEQTTLEDLYKLILEKTKYIEMIKNEKEESQSRVENINELLSNIIRYTEENEKEASLSGFLEEVSLISDIDNYNKDSNAITLMTMHSAKGLEFPVVFLPGFEEGVFPSASTTFNADEVEEERRLAYVGITRAKQKLYIINAQKRIIFGKTSYNATSRFALEIPSDVVEKTGKINLSDIKIENQTDFLKSGSLKPKVNNFSKGFGNFIKQKSESTSKHIFKEGDLIKHKIFGKGKILSAKPIGNDTLVEINFENGSTRKILTNFVKLEILN